VIDRVGGALSLDFVNTAGWHLSDAPNEHLRDAATVRQWARDSGLDVDQVPSLRRIMTVREALFQVVTSRIAGRAPQPGDLAVVNRTLAKAMAAAVLVPDGPELRWQWPDAPPDLLLWAVVRDAAELLTSDRAGQIRMCGNDPCGWLFLDPRGRRRWCSMQGCGNRVKANRYYRNHADAADRLGPPGGRSGRPVKH
jgi:predicted RNA-binding Zn ribbon-like protein